ncbi:putative RNA recognition motif (a k a RRM RBD or RNP domain) [Trypanosoma vivax]|uniref:RRM domain-containing protein n=1 Tax=Trypanosoma vivax (strain Y486) TaxID=1055687 RepID=G0TXR4_TRYVY|nr:hypothetical protein TRVL_07152 [Trypanosoma vivax]KAH8612503.1 putative RNA recognition motif (a k a RRM RBD or RNP domain) [Trypanosoma vivax]CCC48756.1 conserved hypothetical protein [Trypanosoma vivax Y486]
MSEGAVTADVPSVRRVRRMRSHFERLVRPDDIAPGEPMPSIEGWVLFLSNLPPNTTSDHIQDLILSHRDGECGPVREVRVLLDKNCSCCGYALVELERRESFEMALKELDGIVIPFADGEPPNGEDAWRLRAAPTFLGEADDDEDHVAGGKRERE